MGTQPTSKTFGGRLRAARHRRFLTMAQLAEQVGVDWRVVQRWETDRARPHPSNLEKLCAVLGVTYDDLRGHTP